MKNFGDQNEDEDLDKIYRYLTVLQFKTMLHAMATLHKIDPPQKKTPVKKKSCSHRPSYIICSEHWEDWHTKTHYTCAKISVFTWCTMSPI